MSRAEWDALLHSWENELRAGEPVTGGWTPPASPLPPELADRARSLVDRQHTRMAVLRGEQAQVRAHLGAVDRIPADRGDASAYLDVDG